MKKVAKLMGLELELVPQKSSTVAEPLSPGPQQSDASIDSPGMLDCEETSLLSIYDSHSMDESEYITCGPEGLEHRNPPPAVTHLTSSTMDQLVGPSPSQSVAPFLGLSTCSFGSSIISSFASLTSSNTTAATSRSTSLVACIGWVSQAGYLGGQHNVRFRHSHEPRDNFPVIYRRNYNGHSADRCSRQ